MRFTPRVLAVAALLVAMAFLIHHVHALEEAELLGISEKVTYYFAILGLGAVTAVVFCVLLLPLFGEFMGNVFFTPNEQIERNPHADALAQLAAGGIQGALDEYLLVYEDNPEDILAASEIVRLYCEKLGEYDLAAEFLVEALAYPDRTLEDAAFFSQRLVDICWFHQHDGPRARAILLRIIEEMPGTREAANAQHRLQEIERIMNLSAACVIEEDPRNEPALIAPPPASDGSAAAQSESKSESPEKPDFWSISKKPPGSA